MLCSPAPPCLRFPWFPFCFCAVAPAPVSTAGATAQHRSAGSLLGGPSFGSECRIVGSRRFRSLQIVTIRSVSRYASPVLPNRWCVWRRCRKFPSPPRQTKESLFCPSPLLVAQGDLRGRACLALEWSARHALLRCPIAVDLAVGGATEAICVRLDGPIFLVARGRYLTVRRSRIALG